MANNKVENAVFSGVFSRCNGRPCHRALRGVAGGQRRKTSGMCEGGRILHHLKNNISNPNNLLLFVGYAAGHTLARRLMDGKRE
ncbi:MAG: hypothetical protein GY940_07065, partial [bacterium]|nr:hypothetical protein [bacterium]